MADLLRHSLLRPTRIFESPQRQLQDSLWDAESRCEDHAASREYSCSSPVGRENSIITEGWNRVAARMLS